MTIKEFYEKTNGNYHDIKERITADEYIMLFVKQFPPDGSYKKLIHAVNHGDRKAAFEAAHSLKGIAANLSFTELFMAASELSEQLRSQVAPAYKALVMKVTELYESIVKEIGKLDE